MTAFDAAFRARLADLIAWRRDVRRFQARPLPDGTLDRLIAAACRAPSVGLSQPWRFVTVDDPGRRAAIRRSFAEANAEALAAEPDDRAARYATLKLAGLDQAPGQLAAFVDRGTVVGHGLGRRTMPEMAEYSVVAAVVTMWLVARAEGIGMGWVSILHPEAVQAALDVPAEWRLVGYFCLGFPEATDEVPALEREGWEQRRPTTGIIARR